MRCKPAEGLLRHLSQTGEVWSRHLGMVLLLTASSPTVTKMAEIYTGPYLVTQVIQPKDDVLQKSKRAKPFVVHKDKLKLFHGQAPSSWLPKETNTPAAIPHDASDVMVSVATQTTDLENLHLHPTEGGEIAIDPIAGGEVFADPSDGAGDLGAWDAERVGEQTNRQGTPRGARHSALWGIYSK